MLRTRSLLVVERFCGGWDSVMARNGDVGDVATARFDEKGIRMSLYYPSVMNDFGSSVLLRIQPYVSLAYR